MAETKDWAKKHGHTFPTLHDADGKVGKAYGAKTTPHMFVIDAKGTVKYQKVGYSRVKKLVELEAALDELK